MIETNLAHAIDASMDAGAAYDTNVKYLLADKQVLARILKYSVEEFFDISIEEIISCIGNDIKIEAQTVDAGLSNLGSVHKADSEDNVPGEGKIYFDIRFSAFLKEEMKILINVEAQKSSNTSKLGYHLENRMVFYLARMISAQKQTEFYHDDYDNLKKVKSIWICMDSGSDNDSIEEIFLDRRTLFGNPPQPWDIDLLRGIIIHIRSGKNNQESKNTLISMLETLLSGTPSAEKKHLMTERYGMIMSTHLEGEVQTMCNLSELIKEEALRDGLEQGLRDGHAKGLRDGLEQGLRDGRLSLIRDFISNGGSKEDAIRMLNVTEEEIASAMQC